MHRELSPDASAEDFIIDIERSLGARFVFRGDDFSDFGRKGPSFIYVRTGGTEGLFKSVFPSFPADGKVLLLTSGKSNSLAASMEILSYLRQAGREGEILHGSTAFIASRIISLSTGENGVSAESDSVPGLRLLGEDELAEIRSRLSGHRLGVIGKPSDWLISSDVDPCVAKSMLGIELVDIPIGQVVDSVRSSCADLPSFKGSEAIYDALKSIVAEYGLDALTIRCFDLLDTLHNTGCLALARLNAEGIPASCEGDVPALISMCIARAFTGCCGFQCNLSRIDQSAQELLFAHCTVPFDMLEKWSYTTHFESGIGTAVKGEVRLGPATILKIGPDLRTVFVAPVEMVRNTSEASLCRTQVVVKAPGLSRYFLTSSIGNHHILVPGHLE